MDAAHDKLYGRIADLLAKEAQKRNGNLVEFPAEVLQVARQILLAAEKREVYPRISCDTTLIPLLYDTIYNKSHPTKELRSFIWFHLNRLQILFFFFPQEIKPAFFLFISSSCAV